MYAMLAGTPTEEALPGQTRVITAAQLPPQQVSQRPTAPEVKIGGYTGRAAPWARLGTSAAATAALREDPRAGVTK